MEKQNPSLRRRGSKGLEGSPDQQVSVGIQIYENSQPTSGNPHKAVTPEGTQVQSPMGHRDGVARTYQASGSNSRSAVRLGLAS